MFLTWAEGEDVMLVCQNIEKKYLGKIAVRDISLAIEPGKIYALLGPNGSGKTTWMKMAAGLVSPTAGSITFDGIPIGVESKKSIAYMSTEPFFYSYMTVQDVGTYYADFFEDFDIAHYRELVERMGLGIKDKAKTLSSGLAAKLNGIDIIARDQVMEAVAQTASSETAIVMSSHLVDELEKIIDNAVFVKEGSIVLKGEADTLRNEHGKTIVELYKEIYASC